MFIAVYICILFEEKAQEMEWSQTHAAARVDSVRMGGGSHIQCSEMEGAKEISDDNSMMSQPCLQQHLYVYF